MPWTGEWGPVNGTELPWAESPVDDEEDGGAETEGADVKGGGSSTLTADERENKVNGGAFSRM